MDTFPHTDPEDTDTEEGLVGLKTKTAVTFLNLGMDAKLPPDGRSQKYSCPRTFGVSVDGFTLLDFLSKKLHFCYLKPQSLYYFSLQQAEDFKCKE